MPGEDQEQDTRSHQDTDATLDGNQRGNDDHQEEAASNNQDTGGSDDGDAHHAPPQTAQFRPGTLIRAEDVEPGFATAWTADGAGKVAAASHFRELDADCEDRAAVGVFLSLLPQDTKAHGLTITRMMPGANGKKQKVMSNAPSKGVIAMFLDLGQPHKVFAILFTRKLDFQALCGSDLSVLEEIKVGDILAFVEPRPSQDRLGDSITILKNPSLLVKLRSNMPNLPRFKLRMSSEANEQIGFYERSKQIQVSNLRVLTSSQEVPCTNVTCDRQSKRCTGCFGRSITEKAFVFLSDVVVEDTPNYDKDGARFQDFRSFAFTAFFCKDINSSSSQAASSTSDELTQFTRMARRRVKNMVNHINITGGWNVAGWHRRGAITESETGDYVLSTTTKGHLVLLAPTNPTSVIGEHYDALMIPPLSD